MSAYIVGGIVRDLIAGRENCDLDIVIEGDAIAVASELRKGLGGHIVIHRRFGTCTLTTAGGLKIDFATARSETYERPGALPTVTFGPLKDDLGRRDFTINAMAVSLDRALYGRLIDLHDGRSDLERGRIRVMHDLSFFDDPTRIMRAVRFQQRFGFAIDAHTEHLIHRAAEGGALGLVQPQRLRDELVLVLSEDDPYGCLKRLDRLTGLGFIHHGLRLAEKDEPRFRRAGDALRWYGSVHPAGHPAEGWQVYLAVLLSRLDAHQASAALRRFAFRRIEEERITALLREQRRVASVLGRRAAVRPSRVYALLKPLSTEMVLALLALVGPGRAAKRIAEHLTAYRHVRLSVRGDHLVGLGLKPGPLYRKVLGEVLARKLDGRIKNEEEEVEAVRKLAGIS